MQRRAYNQMNSFFRKEDMHALPPYVVGSWKMESQGRSFRSHIGASSCYDERKERKGRRCAWRQKTTERIGCATLKGYELLHNSKCRRKPKGTCICNMYRNTYKNTQRNTQEMHKECIGIRRDAEEACPPHLATSGFSRAGYGRFR